MKTFRRLVVLASLSCFVATWFAVILSVYAASQILPNATVEADEQTVAEVIGTFDQAQEAIRARNLDGLMALYAQGYQYYGLRKGDVRRLWADLFAHYDHIANMHVFSAVKLVGSGDEARVEITCTGALWAVAKDTKVRIPIDSWHGEVHHLVKEKGAWRILGNAGGESPRPQQFGTAPHPLF
jgi:hypothetical protein